MDGLDKICKFLGKKTFLKRFTSPIKDKGSLYHWTTMVWKEEMQGEELS